jgi:hypothetical protein
MSDLGKTFVGLNFFWPSGRAVLYLVSAGPPSVGRGSILGLEAANAGGSTWYKPGFESLGSAQVETLSPILLRPAPLVGSDVRS